ncbi:hypothetical protein CDL15_Pgr012606 [Punica granatum]|uniref:Uncharacterized protein n=1 Tax=Punica granatum TaxID=22663 RepID=A0A218XZD7_PUNGR|nr:hypothetical protein CDL15_Pgr012606 [Punica granatum]
MPGKKKKRNINPSTVKNRKNRYKSIGSEQFVCHFCGKWLDEAAVTMQQFQENQSH